MPGQADVAATRGEMSVPDEPEVSGTDDLEGPQPEADAPQADWHPGMPGGLGKTRGPYRQRPNWSLVEVAYVRGTEIDGELVFPSLRELADKFNVAPRQCEHHSVKRRWSEKRAEFQQEFAIESQRRRVGRLLQEMEKFDATSLTIAKVALNEVMRTFSAVQAERKLRGDATVSASALDTLLRAAERAQKIGRLAMNLPTELIAASEDAERKRQEQSKVAGVDRDGAVLKMIEKINGLEGEKFLEAMSGILGAPPGGSVIDVPVVPIRMLPPARPPEGSE